MALRTTGEDRRLPSRMGSRHRSAAAGGESTGPPLPGAPRPTALRSPHGHPRLPLKDGGFPGRRSQVAAYQPQALDGSDDDTSNWFTEVLRYLVTVHQPMYLYLSSSRRMVRAFRFMGQVQQTLADHVHRVIDSTGRETDPRSAGGQLDFYFQGMFSALDRDSLVRIFDLYLGGTGLRGIAGRLNEEGVPCPSAHDPKRNPHRLGDGWQASTVRAVLTNPRYTGTQVWGRWHRVERLLDLTDVAAGTVTRFQRSAPERVVASMRPAHLGLASQETFDRVQSLLTSSAAAGGSKPRSARAATSPYQLRGLLNCRLCGRRMAGHRRGPTLYYRCRAADLIPAQRKGHPSTVNVREDTLVPLLQEWLLGFFAPDRLDQTMEALAGANGPSLAESTQRAVVTGRLKDAEKGLAQYKAALGQGADVTLVSAWINEATADLAQARLDLSTVNSAVPQHMSRDDLERVVDDMSLVVSRIAAADPATKAALYRALGLRLTYGHDEQEVEAEISTAEACVRRGVRGGT